MSEIMKQLQEPFDPLEIEWRVGVTNADKTKGLALAYVTNRAIMNRLDDVFGCFGWKNEFKEWHGKSQLCGISILHDGEWITKWDGADDSNIDATKGGLSDAMKRAAYQWGIGRYLYSLPDVWMPLEMRGKTPVIKGIPSLPKWALPNGFTQAKSPNETAPKDLTINNGHLEILTNACMTDGKRDDNKIKILHGIYTKRGRATAKDILVSEINEITKEFMEAIK